MKTKISLKCFLAIGTLITVVNVSVCSLASADVWNVNTDMNASINDNGIWSYGYAVGDPTDPNRIPIYEGLLEDSGVRVGANILWLKEWQGAAPHLWVGPEVGVPAGVHGMKPGYTTTGPAVEVPALIRWTAPASFAAPSVVSIDASMYLSQGGLVDAYIVKSVAADPNQRTVLLEQIGVTPESPMAFSDTCEVTAGDTIDVMVCAHGPADLANTDWNAVSFAISDSCTTQLPMDFNWDCYVNLEDFAIFAQSWLDCNDQSNTICE